MDGITLRKARAGELAPVQAIARRVILARYPAFLGEQAVRDYVGSGEADRDLARHGDDLHVLVRGDRILGLAICPGDLVHLLMVGPGDQRQGHGSRLLAWCEAAIAARGHGTARLESFAANGPAVAFYRKNGWSEVDRDGPGPLARIRFAKRVG